MRKKIGLCICFFMLCFFAVACTKGDEKVNQGLSVQAADSEIKFVPSTEQVDEFVKKNSDSPNMYDDDVCYNITPDFISDHSAYSIFKYSKSCGSYLMYEDKIYVMGLYFGGYGVTSVALGDLNKDGQYELYFTFSCGSGVHQSYIGYFDPADGANHIIEYKNENNDLILTAGSSGELCVSEAEIDHTTFADFTIRSADLIGNLVWDEDVAVLEEKE